MSPCFSVGRIKPNLIRILQKEIMNYIGTTTTTIYNIYTDNNFIWAQSEEYQGILS